MDEIFRETKEAEDPLELREVCGEESPFEVKEV